MSRSRSPVFVSRLLCTGAATLRGASAAAEASSTGDSQRYACQGIKGLLSQLAGRPAGSPVTSPLIVCSAMQITTSVVIDVCA